MRKITAAILREHLSYDPKTGIFRRRSGAPNKPNYPAGSVAGCDNGHGYLVIRVCGELYLASRLAWLYMTGEWPEKQIDHRNGKRSDNAWINLREATNGQNQANAKRRRDNVSGSKGICWERRRRHWRVTITKDGKQNHVGGFKLLDDARAAYAEEAKRLFGEFARAE